MKPAHDLCGGRKASPAAGAEAFTLLEILIAATILAMVVAVLAQIASFVASAWTTGSGNAERRENGRALIEFIGNELRSAVIPISTVGSAPNLQFVRNPDGVTSYPSSLFWQAPVATDTTYGDLAEVGYFVKWDTNGKVPQANLCRFFVNPGNANYKIYNSTSWITSDIVQSVAPADKDHGYVGLFAENVIGFWARCFKADGTEITTCDSRKNTPGLPAMVEISLVLLDSHAAARMTDGFKTKLAGIVSTASVKNAGDCVAAMQADSTLKPISGGARAYSTSVYLENSK